MCSFLRYRLNNFLPPFPEIGCPKFLEVWIPWGEKWLEVVSDLIKITNKGCKIAAQKAVFFWRILPSSLPPLSAQILPPSQGEFCHTEQDLFGIGATIHIG